jgi:hypothetical protein
MAHRYSPNEERGDAPLAVYERLHDPAKTTFANVRKQWDLCAAAGITPTQLGRLDRFYLLTVLLKRKDAFKSWLFDRCREVEADPDGYLDLWAREHYKSTIITFAGIIQEVLRDPEITICIFSHTRPGANKFLGHIKREFEHNQILKEAYPDVLWANAYKDAPMWSLEKGISVIRQGNSKEATIEASGLVDGMPTGSHYMLRVYDDVVTAKSVATPEQIQKATDAYELSDNLGARGPDGMMREWVIGTRYSFADTYQSIIDKRVLKIRKYAATDDGTRTGNPVFLSRKALDAKLAKQASHIFACQQLLNPSAGTEAMFDGKWFRFNDIRPATLNVYIMVDPAGSKKKGSDNTAMSVVGIDAGRSKWLLDGYCHKMGLAERWAKMKELRQKWSEMPGVQLVSVGYESYGIPDALDHFEERMEIEKNYFPIVVLQWPRQELGSKHDRIMRLEPDIRGGKFFMSKTLLDAEGRPTKEESPAQREMRRLGQDFRIFMPMHRLDENRRLYSVNRVFLDEALVFPFAQHDDFLDATSRIFDMDPRPPVLVNERDTEPEAFADGA